MKAQKEKGKEKDKDKGFITLKWSALIVGLALVVISFLAGLFAHELIFPGPRLAEWSALSSQVNELVKKVEALSSQVAELSRPSQGQGNQKTGTAPERVEVSTDDDPALGQANAPVVIVEFSDFQCPFCARFAQQTFPQLKREYIDTGKVKLVFRDFPLSFHKNAALAAEAAQCAYEQDAFWEMHDKLFDNQGEWAGAADAKGVFVKYAEELGLDQDRFRECLDSGRYREEIQKDFKDGMSYGVRGTPTFFINGRKLVGAQPFSAFQRMIEEELSSKEE